MIDDPLPQDWRDLQSGVQRIFRNVGLTAEVEVDLDTPRGSVNVDVLAVDMRSVDKIKYIVECKNWASAIPQAVVHSFTTVMHETGANVGFIISKNGLQKGAQRYTQNTNIIGMTYLEFQQRYFEAWWTRYFCPLIGDTADTPLQYVEPCNGVRDRAYDALGPEQKEKFDLLYALHAVPVMSLSTLNYRAMSPVLGSDVLLGLPKDLDDFKSRVLTLISPHIRWHCDTFRGLLDVILKYLKDVETAFDEVFGGSIFEPRAPIIGVTLDGPLGMGS